MGIEDRDWYREAYQNKEKKYGTDFSGTYVKRDKQNTSKSKQQYSSNKTQNRESSSINRQQHDSYNSESQNDSITPNKDFIEKNICSTVFSPNGSYGTLRLGSDAKDDRMMIVLGVCPKCYNCFPVNIHKNHLYHYNYTCPECEQEVTIRSKAGISVGKRIGKTFLGLFAFVVSIIVIGYLGNYIYDHVFPTVYVWFLNLKL